MPLPAVDSMGKWWWWRYRMAAATCPSAIPGASRPWKAEGASEPQRGDCRVAGRLRPLGSSCGDRQPRASFIGSGMGKDLAEAAGGKYVQLPKAAATRDRAIGPLELSMAPEAGPGLKAGPGVRGATWPLSRLALFCPGPAGPCRACRGQSVLGGVDLVEQLAHRSPTLAAHAHP